MSDQGVVCTRIRLGPDRTWFGFRNQDSGLWWKSDHTIKKEGRMKSVLIGGWTISPGQLSIVES